ncbi:MAG: alpha/beta fold hydrolase [Bdellovibrionales bacterium]|nr:alpha/beta fold hydrolase [Bdellovibrionales bacterium]
MTLLLHGFWGQPADWNQVLARLPLNAEVFVPDLYEAGPFSPNKAMAQWAENMIAHIEAHTSAPVKLVGYSMGARLALALLTRKPQLFSRALLLSGAPGLHPGVTPHARQEWEKDWAGRFLHEDWQKLEDAWDKQEVFTHSATQAPRRRSQILREMLALSLLHWSPRVHPYSVEQIKALKSSVQWAFGALDQKYVKLAKTLQELPVQGQITIIPNAGHRLPTTAAEFVGDWIVQGGS